MDILTAAPAGFAARYSELRGDAYVQLGDIESAQSSYQESIAALPQNSPWRTLVQLKLENIGGYQVN